MGPTGLLTLVKLRMPVSESAAVRLWGIILPEVEHWIGDGPYRVTDLSQTPNAGK